MNEKEILKMINDYWNTIPKESLPTYGQFNVIIPSDVKALRELEKQNPKVGVANFGKPNEGITTISFISSITDILCNKRLAAILDGAEGKNYGDQKIIGWEFHKE